MTHDTVTSASREVNAPAEIIFELIADPARQPEWDGNGNLQSAAPGQRVRAARDVFDMLNTSGRVRANHVTEFEEGRLIAWKPAEVGGEPFGQLWRWQLEPLDGGRTRVTHSYDYSQLTDEKRLAKARGTSSAMLDASIVRLKELAESL